MAVGSADPCDVAVWPHEHRVKIRGTLVAARFHYFDAIRPI
jgi:hypothetical protein